MIRSLMYLTTSRPDIMYAYPRDSPFKLVAYTDSDYAGASLDRKSTTGGCQFMRRELISWQCKKQTVVATYIIKAEYVAAASCCRQFWQSATTRTLDNREMKITATINRKVKVVTEASIRRHLKLDDSEGSTVPIESHHTPTGAPSTSPPHLSSPPRSSIRQETEVPQSSSPSHTHVGDEATSTGVDVRHIGVATIVTSLDARQGSGNIDKTSSMPYDSPLPRVNTLGSDEGEKTVKTGKARRKAQIVVSDDEEEFEDPSKQERSMIEEINQDAKVTLVTPTQVSTQGEAHSQPKDQLGVLSAAKILVDVAKVYTYTRRRMAVNTGSDGISTTRRIVSTAEESVSTNGASMPVSTASTIDKDVRLQEQFDEEERQKLARFHEVAQTFTKEEWENIRARVEADEELTQKLQAEEMEKYSEVDQAKMLIDLINKKRYFAEQKLKKLSFDEIKELFKATMRSIIDFVPIESEDDKAVPKLAEARSLKRDSEEELEHKGSKKQKTSEALGSAQEQPGKEEKELSQEDLQQLMIIDAEQGMNVESLQVKYLIIDWEIYTEDTRKYWKIIKVRNHTEVYQFFDDMLKVFDMDDLVMLCELVFMGEEKRNLLMKHIMWLVDDFEAWNTFPLGEYMWEKFYNRTVNVVSRHTEHHVLYNNALRSLLGKLSGNGKLVNDGDGVLDSQPDDGDDVLDSQTKDVIEEASMLPTMSSNSPQAGNAAVLNLMLLKRNDCNPKRSDGGVSIEEKPNFSSHHNDSSNHIGGMSSEAKASSSFAHSGNDGDVSHLDDSIEIDGLNAKDHYSNSQHHLHLLIKALGPKIENLSIDSVVVVPPKVDDLMWIVMMMTTCHCSTMKRNLPNYCYDLELQQEPDIVDVKDRILEQQANADKGKTTVIQETVEVTVEEQPSSGKGLGTLKFKKKNCERALRPYYILRSAKIRKKKMVMSLKSPFGQQSDTTPVPTKRKTRLNKTEYIVRPFDLEDISGQPRIRSMNHIMTHDPFVEHLDLWIDLMWSLRPPEAYWGIVYFSVNEPKQHWCLAQLEIRTGVVTFFYSLGWAGGSRRRW
nr:hypothetical protein [Tanacetum cinerariifolium]